MLWERLYRLKQNGALVWKTPHCLFCQPMPILGLILFTIERK